MTNRTKDIALPIAIAVLLFTAGCGTQGPQEQKVYADGPPPAATEPVLYEPEIAPSPQLPNLQAEILDDRGKTSMSPLITVDFKNFTYPLPRGWQHQDGDEIT